MRRRRDRTREPVSSFLCAGAVQARAPESEARGTRWVTVHPAQGAEGALCAGAMEARARARALQGLPLEPGVFHWEGGTSERGSGLVQKWEDG